MLKTDIFGNTPEIGDLIIFNPSDYKGLEIGECVGFSKSGLPEIIKWGINENSYFGVTNKNGYYTPKTGFAIYKNK